MKSEMKVQINGGGKNDSSSEVLSLVPSGKIFDFYRFHDCWK